MALNCWFIETEKSFTLTVNNLVTTRFSAVKINFTSAGLCRGVRRYGNIMENSFLIVADSYLKLGEFEKAEDYYSQALKYENGCAPAYKGLFLAECGFISFEEMCEKADSALLFSAEKNKYLSKAVKLGGDGFASEIKNFITAAKARGEEVKKWEEEARRAQSDAEKRGKEISRFYEYENGRIISCRRAGASPEFFPELTEIGDDAFKGLKSIKSVEVPEDITYIGESAFEGCKGLRSVKISAPPQKFGQAAFFACVNLESASLPEGLSSIPRNTFFNCRNLSEVNLPASLKEIEEGAFEGCNEIKELKLPKKLEEIGKYAFYGCEKIENLTIPESVKGIGESAFERCGLKEVVLPRRFKKLRKKIFGKKLGGYFSKVKFIYI